MNNICQNCNSITENNFCSVCGQKTSTHRYSLKHFVVHDLVHGVFHLDKGFFFTLKELFTTPGHSIREFIQGKRANHFNYFTLLILIVTIGHLVGKIPAVTLYEIMEQNNVLKGQSRVIQDYGKIIVLAGIPIYAVISYLIYYKSRQNYTEHLVMTMYFTSATLIFYLIPHVTVMFTKEYRIIRWFSIITVLIENAYYFWFFYQYFSAFKFSKRGLIWRGFVMVILMLLTSAVINTIVDNIGLRYFH